MATNSRLENFKKILDIIDAELKKEGNEPLYEELRRRYGSFDIPSHEPSKIDKIEQYLGLDYKLDSVSDIFDYDFVKDDNPELFDQLTSDYREMMRYRYGTRGHITDFGEFCRYANLQLEALTNWSLAMKYPDISQLLSFMDNNNNKFYEERIEKKYEYYSVYDIPYASKLYSICKFANIPYMQSATLNNIRGVRNLNSHRSNSKNEKDPKEEKFIKWKEQKDFIGCMDAIHKYVNTIKDMINK